MKRKRVYLFACIEKNIGDDLFIYAVAKRYLNVDFIISSTAEYMEINNLNNLIYSKKFKKWLRFANNSSKNLFKRLIASIIEKIFRIQLERLDSIYIVGNAFKNMNYKGKYQIKWLERRLKISKNFYLISTNYGPSNNDLWRRDCHNVFSKMTDICFRDKNSYDSFKDLKNVRYAPDVVLSLKDIIVPKINKSTKEYVIISIIDCSLDNRSEKLKSSSDLYEKKMVSLIDNFNNDGTKVIILNSNSIQDEPAALRIKSKCIKKDMVSIYNYNGDLNKVFELYCKAKSIIATRLHTIILGWIFNIPVVPIVYDIKVNNLLNSYDFDSLRFDFDNLEKIDYCQVKKKIKNYSFKLSDEIYKKSNSQFTKIDELLK